MHSPIHEFSERERLDMQSDRLAETDKDRKKGQHFPVQVVLRCRPSTTAEKRTNLPLALSCTTDQEIEVKTTEKGQKLTKTYRFDRVFSSSSNQNEVYDFAVRPIVQDVLLGFNCTVFAYGQTGTGKTHTMEGKLTNDSNNRDAGVIPRSINTIFEHLEKHSKEFSVKVSVMEIYNEELSDLLSDDASKTLRIFEDPQGKKGMMVSGLEELLVTSPDEVFGLLRKSSEKRKTAETNLNKSSSRSHSVFMVTTHTKEVMADGEDVIRTGKLFLVDLAGSECVGKSGALKERGFEAGKINQSLLTLGRVINALVEKSPYIPYRDSKLTRLLQESLGGRSKTVIIATVSPSVVCVEETLSTLDYAHRAKNIRNRPQVNQKLSGKAYMRELLCEINDLKRENEVLRQKNGIFLAPEKWESMTLELKSQAERLFAQEDELEAAAQALEEANHFIAHQLQLEEELAGQAREVKDKLEAALRDCATLHDKLERKRKAEGCNETATAQLKSALHQDIAKIEAEVGGFVGHSNKSCLELSSSLSSFAARNARELEGVVKRVEEVVAVVEAGKQQLGAMAARFKCSNSELAEANAGQREAHGVQLAGALGDVQGSVEAALLALRSHVDEAQRQVSEWEGAVGSAVESAVGRTADFTSDMTRHLNQLHEGFLAHALAQEKETEEQSKLVDALVAQQEQAGREAGHTILHSLQHLLADIHSNQWGGLSRSADSLKQTFLAHQRARGEFGSAVGSRVEAALARSTLFSQETEEWGTKVSEENKSTSGKLSLAHQRHLGGLSETHNQAIAALQAVAARGEEQKAKEAAQRSSERELVETHVAGVEAAAADMALRSTALSSLHNTATNMVASSLGARASAVEAETGRLGKASSQFASCHDVLLGQARGRLQRFQLQVEVGAGSGSGGTPKTPKRKPVGSPCVFKRSRAREAVVSEFRKTRQAKARKMIPSNLNPTITLATPAKLAAAMSVPAAAAAAVSAHVAPGVAPDAVPAELVERVAEDEEVELELEVEVEVLQAVGGAEGSVTCNVPCVAVLSEIAADANISEDANTKSNILTKVAPNTGRGTEKRKNGAGAAGAAAAAAGGSKIPLFTGKTSGGGSGSGSGSGMPVENLLDKLAAANATAMLMATPSKFKTPGENERKRRTRGEDKENLSQ